MSGAMLIPPNRLPALALNIRRQREFLGFSREGLAEHASVPVSWLEMVERASYQSVDIRTVQRVARSLRTDSSKLLSDQPPPGPATARRITGELVEMRPRIGTARAAAGLPSLLPGRDWPRRLVAAARIHSLLADAAGDAEGAAFWRGALEIALCLLRMESAA